MDDHPDAARPDPESLPPTERPGSHAIPELKSGSWLLTPAERHQILFEWNNTAASYPRDTCVHQLFEEQVRRTPEAVAVVFEDQHLTYAELNRRANQLAHQLRRLGVRPDVMVAFCLNRSLEMVVALLAILKAGAAYVPLDPDYPQDRLAFMLQDSGAPLLLTQEKLLPRLSTVTRALCLDREWDQVREQPHTNPATVVTGQNLAYVIYTSGSTGRPKGVQIPHHALVNFLCSFRQHPGICAEDVLLAVTTLSFDIAALELFLPLVAGARIVLVPREEAADGSRLAQRIAASGATILQATPATWKLLLAAGWSGRKTLRALCGGETLPEPLAVELLGRVGELWNLYGPTETTVWSSLWQVDRPVGAVPIGRPIQNTRLYILDRELQPTPTGIAG